MACYHPLQAFQGADGSVFFHEDRSHLSVRTLELPCGQCIGCRLERSRQWAVRCMHEASLWECNHFVTLTYRDEECPVSLRYRDFQLFMKRLRREQKARVRFFMAGEYGETFGRPHYHACLFNCWLPDLEPVSVLGGVSRLYRSAVLDRIWSHGFTTVGSVTFESAAYVARYCLKKVTGQGAEAHYRITDIETGEVTGRVPEFTHMSLRPGIGALWVDRFMSDAYPHGMVVANGKEVRAPRYYDKRFKRVDAVGMEALEFDRYLRGKERAADNTPARLAVREAVTKARTSRFKRGDL